MLGDYQFYHKITGNGACLTNSLSMAWYGSEDESAKIRMNLNQHIVSNFELYGHAFVFSVTITTGVGKSRKDHTFDYENALKEFLLSKESTLMWNSDCDLQALCNLYFYRISVFSYTKSGGHWIHL